MIKEIFARRWNFFRDVSPVSFLLKFSAIAIVLVGRIEYALFIILLYVDRSMKKDGCIGDVMYLLPIDRAYRKKLIYVKSAIANLDGLILLAISSVFPWKLEFIGEVKRIDYSAENIVICICAYVFTYIFFFRINIANTHDNSFDYCISPKKKARREQFIFDGYGIVSFALVFLSWHCLEKGTFVNSSEIIKTITVILVCVETVLELLIFNHKKYKIVDYREHSRN